MSKQPLVDQLDLAISRILAEPDVQVTGVDAAVLELLGVARGLRELPRPEFKARLRMELERKMSMTTSVKTVSFREGFRTVTPYLLLQKAEHVDFLKNVFGAVETERTNSPRGFHAEVRIGDSMLMMGYGSGLTMPLMMQLHVPNVDEVYERALAAGSKSLLALNEGHGDRYGVVQDPEGNQWILSTYLGKHYIPENLNSLTTWFHPKGAAKFIDFLQRAFGATEVMRHDSPEGKVNYAQVRIGTSVIALNDPHAEWMPSAGMYYLYVPNVDELYAQTLSAGAKSMTQPKDESYGDRTASVQDEWGNIWYMATPAQ